MTAKQRNARMLVSARKMLRASRAAIAAWHADDSNFRRELNGTPDWLKAMRDFVKESEQVA